MEEELKKKLFKDESTGWENLSEEENSKLNEVSDSYMEFLNKAKTEREFIKYAKELADENGYRDIMTFETLKPGDKVYFINRKKNRDRKRRKAIRSNRAAQIGYYAL